MSDDELEHLKDCLARWVCNLKPRKERHGFLDRFQGRNGKTVADDIRRRVQREWKKRRGKSQGG